MPHAEIDHDDPTRILITTEWADKELVKQVPGANWFSSKRAWTAPLSWATAVVLRGIFQERFTYGEGLRSVLQALKDGWVDPAMAWREQYEVPVLDGIGLYPHQQCGVNFLAFASHGAMITDEMGTGKTPTVISSLRSFGAQALPALVICPNSVKSQWQDEIHRWWSEATPYVIGGGMAKRRKQLAEAREDPSSVSIINYEAVRLHTRLAPYGSIRLQRCIEHGGTHESIAKCEVHPKELNEFGFRSVVADEAHRIIDPKAKQTRACWSVFHGPTVSYRIAMTGTPISDNVADLWSIGHAIAPQDFPTKSDFVDRYALLAWNRYASLDIVGVRPDTRDELRRLLYPRMRRMLKAIVLPHLPAKVREMREAPMTPAQAKMYREMEEELLAETETGEFVIAPSNLTKALRLLQFSSSTCEIIDDHVRLKEPSAKLDVLMEVLDELGDRQVAVCAASRQLIELAAARLNAHKPSPITYRLLTGAVPQAVRPQNLDDFAEGRARVMLFTLAAGGVGVNLTAADTIVFLQRSWSMLENRQAEDRVHRIGSERHESITIVDIVAPDTIEVRQLRRLREKLERLEEIVGDRERMHAAGQAVEDGQYDQAIAQLEGGYTL